MSGVCLKIKHLFFVLFFNCEPYYYKIDTLSKIYISARKIGAANMFINKNKHIIFVNKHINKNNVNNMFITKTLTLL